MPKYLVILHDAQDDTPAGREELKLRMCDTLKVSAKAVLNIFQALPVIIRRDLELAVAEKYALTLERLGAVVEVIEQPDQLPEEQSLHVLDDLPAPAKKPEALAFTAEQEQELGDLEAMLDDALHAGESPAEKKATSAVPPRENPAEAAPPADDDFGLSLSFDDEPAVQRAPVILDMLEDESVQAAPPPKPAPVSPPAAAAPAAESAAHAEPEPSDEPAAAQPEQPPVQMGAFASPYSAARPVEQPEPWVPPPPAPEKKRGLSARQAGIGAMCVFLLVTVAFGKSALEAMLGGGRQTMQITFDIDKLLKEQGSILGLSKSDDDSPAEITGHWVGESDEQGVSTRMRITELGKVMQLAALEVNTVQPAPLTDKELVQGKPLPVWLRKFEAVNVRLLPASAEGLAGTLRFAGNGRAYLQDGKGNDRQLVEVEIQVPAPKEGVSTLEASWILRRALNGADPDTNLVSRLSKKDFQVFFRGKASVTFEKPTIAKKIPKK